jgi:hypothetical protein
MNNSPATLKAPIKPTSRAVKRSAGDQRAQSFAKLFNMATPSCIQWGMYW